VPFKSKKQREYMRIHHPELYKKWCKEYGHEPVKEAAEGYAVAYLAGEDLLAEWNWRRQGNRSKGVIQSGVSKVKTYHGPGKYSYKPHPLGTKGVQTIKALNKMKINVGPKSNSLNIEHFGKGIGKTRVYAGPTGGKGGKKVAYTNRFGRLVKYRPRAQRLAAGSVSHKA
jgi:hypothetical protein